MVVKNVILIVDDDTALLERHKSLVQSIAPEGYQIKTATTYEEAEEALKQRNVAMLITDNQFPNPFVVKTQMRTYNAANHMKADEAKTRLDITQDFFQNPGIQVARLARLMDKELPIVWNSTGFDAEKVEALRAAVKSPPQGTSPFTQSTPFIRLDNNTLAVNKNGGVDSIKSFIQEKFSVAANRGAGTER